jgi:adenosylmethionine---8-amino-7-oxononanoate aminotransferase
MTNFEWIDRNHYWHAFTQMAEYQPLIIQEAQGVWMTDQHGRQLLDGGSSMWCNVHGHRHPSIDHAIRLQLDRVAHVTSLGMSNPTTIQLTEKLVEIAPGDLECVFYSSDGASAVEVALKMAFQYWRQIGSPQPDRTLYLAVGGAYHGDTIGAVSVGGVARFHAMFSPLLFDVVQGPMPDTYRYPDDVPEEQLTEYYLAQYQTLFETYGDRTAAVIIEPLLQAAAGMVVHPKAFLSGIVELARQYDILVIVDEIATGMGRTGRMWACEWESVQPDFLCAGKGLSGGYLPISATLATRRIWNAFLGDYSQSRSFFHGHTYGGNPLASAAALATIDLFDSEQTLANVRSKADYLAEKLSPLESHANVGQVRQLGLAAAIELVECKESRLGFPWQDRVGSQVCQRALEHGLWVRPLGNVIVVMPPLCISCDHLDHLTTALTLSIEQQFGKRRSELAYFSSSCNSSRYRMLDDSSRIDSSGIDSSRIGSPAEGNVSAGDEGSAD